MITDLHPAVCCSVSPAVCRSAAPPSFGAFLVGSEQPSGAARHRRPPREGGPHYSPKTGWWLSAGPAGRLPGTPPRGSAEGPDRGRIHYTIFTTLCGLEAVQYTDLSLGAIWWSNPEKLSDSANSAETHLVWHERGDGAPNLVVVNVGGRWAQQEEEEPHRDRNLQDGLQQNRLVQPHKRHGGLVQEAHTACRDSRGMHLTDIWMKVMMRMWCVPTRTTVASALSGIFSISFTSCLDLEWQWGGASFWTHIHTHTACTHQINGDAE